MGNSDREHFTQYRHQTRIKHAIITRYIKAFFTILKKWKKNLVYIDAFAGRGTYDDPASGNTIAGSPIQALELLAEDPDLAKKVTPILIEKDPENFERLRKEVEAFHSKNNAIREPRLCEGDFETHVDTILSELKSTGLQLAPTFLFVDPCGIDGVSLDAIVRVLANDSCEALVFFNIEGVRRVAGLEKLSPVLVSMFGNEERATALLRELETINRTEDRENTIVEHYRRALGEASGAEYFIPFRIESEHRRITSHYLIHITKHPMGFRIMKDVMWKLGKSREGTGLLGLEQASLDEEDQLVFIRPDWDNFKESILTRLKEGVVNVGAIRSWVEQPEDRFSEPAYKEAIIELEAMGKIIILDKDGRTPKPATSRRKLKGKATLGDNYFIALS